MLNLQAILYSFRSELEKEYKEGTLFRTNGVLCDVPYDCTISSNGTFDGVTLYVGGVTFGVVVNTRDNVLSGCLGGQYEEISLRAGLCRGITTYYWQIVSSRATRPLRLSAK